jgi:hypothetical protein
LTFRVKKDIFPDCAGDHDIRKCSGEFPPRCEQIFSCYIREKLPDIPAHPELPDRHEKFPSPGQGKDLLNPLNDQMTIHGYEGEFYP